MQKSLFSFSEKQSKTTTVIHKESSFVAPTLENALQSGNCQDYAMMWLRSLMKKHKSNPSLFLQLIQAEMACKQTGSDVTSIVRLCILMSTHTKSSY
jgi:hypothetical protein